MAVLPVAPTSSADPEAAAAVLAARAALHLRAAAMAGAGDPDAHLERLRRLLIRREGRPSLARRRQIAHAVTAARTGRPGAIAALDRQALVDDLRRLEHALAAAARVGSAHSVAEGA